jgi:Protein of unknown function (DUF3500)
VPDTTGLPLDGPSSQDVYEAPATIGKMLLAAHAFLGTLSHEQRTACMFPMDHAGRADWDFIPKPDRLGLPLAHLGQHQRVLAQAVLRSGLSLRGYTQALAIMAMENVLREKEWPRLGYIAPDFRSPEMYFLSFYGRPGFEDTWAWRFLGHHLSLSYTVIGQRWLSVTPCNMGAQPTAAGVLSPLRSDEDLGFELLGGMPAPIRKAAVIHDVAPADYATRQVPRVGKVEYPDYVDLGMPGYRLTDADREALKFERSRPRGVPGSELPRRQRDVLMDIVRSFVGRMPDEVAARHLQQIKTSGLADMWFCWAGGQESGTSHYYRVQGTRLLIEFDNAIDSGNHIHSVWRDLSNDLGFELLLTHYERERVQGHHLATRLQSSVPED